MDANKFRAFLKQRMNWYMLSGQLKNCIFWYEKLCCLSDYASGDLCTLCLLLLKDGQYSRAYRCALWYCEHLPGLWATVLMAVAQFGLKQYKEAHGLLFNSPIPNILSGEEHISRDWSLVVGLRCYVSALIRLGFPELETVFRWLLTVDPMSLSSDDVLLNLDFLNLDGILEVVADRRNYSGLVSQPELDLVHSILHYTLHPKSKSHAAVSLVARASSHWRITTARHLYSQGLYKASHSVLTDVVKQHRFHPCATYTLCNVLVKLQRPAEAYHMSQEMVRFYPDRSLSLFGVACYYLLSERSYTARSVALDMLSSAGHHPFLKLFAGHTLSECGERDKAIAQYMAVSAAMPNSYIPELNISMECVLGGEWVRAWSHLQCAHQLSPESPFVLNQMGYVLHHLGQHREAHDCFANAFAVITRLPSWRLHDLALTVLFNLSAKLMQIGDLGKAISYLQVSVSLNPTDMALRRVLGTMLMHHQALPRAMPIILTAAVPILLADEKRTFDSDKLFLSGVLASAEACLELDNKDVCKGPSDPVERQGWPEGGPEPHTSSSSFAMLDDYDGSMNMSC